MHLQSEEVLDNRTQFVEMLVAMEHIAVNTKFDKDEKNNVTFQTGQAASRRTAVDEGEI